VIAGQDDTATPPGTVRGLADAIPGSSFVTAAGAHLVNVEAAPTVTRSLATHLASHRRHESPQASRPQPVASDNFSG
jgi:pimeloyl-ACP methyl ester carboxylesterase